ncbi:MAG: RNA 2',3'-cyclic phosphodiesterase [Sulfolobales archaeon]|nr:RNA 2',3'-cyclic phosphodiesterase [Ignisphaera sp.]MCX8199784.1 RNA 2',3'-cyclic phosphodiesterase [Sulfolobales archaeon]MDW8084977.1 RNA 2',3'-cyclic phosphodiesterase [Ignisphaera sp.]
MSVRAFIAIEIEDRDTLINIIKVRDVLANLGLDIKPVEDENLHITMRFLGEISAHTIEEIKKLLISIPSIMKSFSVTIKGIGAFPNVMRPRVIWAGITDGADKLTLIREFIDRELVKMRLSDVHKDQHGFSPHITLARVRSLKNVERFQKLYTEYQDYLFGVSPISIIKLKQSILTPRGPIYRDIFSVKI